MTKKQVLEDYLNFKRTSVNSKAKLKDIEHYTNLFFKSFKGSVEKAGEKELVNFLNSISDKYSIGSLNGIKAQMKNFIKWYYADWSSRFRNIDKLCRSEKPPKTYQPEQMLKIKDVEKLIKGEKDLMWKCYWLTFFYGGFRPSEVCRLEWKEINFEKDGVIIKLHTTKTGKDFYKALPKNVEHYLKEWKGFNHSEFVFPSPIKEGYHIHIKSVYHRLKHLSKRVLNKHISPYILRHSIATIKYNDDHLKTDDVANHMGHSKDMKHTYLTLDEDGLKTRARKLWIKPKELTPQERDELEELRKRMGLMEKDNELMKKSIRNVHLSIREEINKIVEMAQSQQEKDKMLRVIKLNSK